VDSIAHRTEINGPTGSVLSAATLLPCGSETQGPADVEDELANADPSQNPRIVESGRFPIRAAGQKGWREAGVGSNDVSLGTADGVIRSTRHGQNTYEGQSSAGSLLRGLADRIIGDRRGRRDEGAPEVFLLRFECI
jgi:hypothetical protein